MRSRKEAGAEEEPPEVQKLYVKDVNEIKKEWTKVVELLDQAGAAVWVTVIDDCCPEPVAGPVVDARALRHAWTALGPLALGGWPVRCGLVQHREETLAVLDEVLAGLYLAVDAEGRLRWLGKAHRDGGVGARLRDHFRHPERARVFAGGVRRGGRPVQPAAGDQGR